MTAPPDPTLPYRITIRNFVGITLMAVLIFVIGGIILVKMEPTVFSPQRPFVDRLMWVALLTTAGVLASTGYVLASRTALGWGIIGLIRPDVRWVLIAIATATGLFVAGERLDAFLGFGIIENTRANFASSLNTQVGMIGMFAVMAIVLPIPLEIYFRGVLFNFLRARLNVETAIGATALLYGLVYYNPLIPVYMAYGVIYGVAFCVLFLRSGSLWTAIVANGTVQALTMVRLILG
jgi:membrane protease YdiL (CAAX protease family)